MITGWDHEQLHTDSPVPYYAQLKYVLSARIRTLPPHTALPSEQELQDLFSVSRTVVRQALLELVHEGLVYRRKGKGSFVAPPKVTEGQIQRLTSFSDEMSRQGYHPVTVVLEQQIVEAHPELAQRLEITPGAAVVALKRVRVLDGQPLMLASTWLPRDLCPGLESADLATRSLYEVLKSDHARIVERGSRTLEAVPATKEQADLLETQAGSPLMRLEVLSYEQSGRVLEYSVAFHRGDRAKFQFDVTASQPPMEMM